MSDLKARAAQAAERQEGKSEPGDVYEYVAGVQRAEMDREELPEITYTDPIEDVEMVPVVVAWIRVMRDVKSIDKKSTAKINTSDGKSYSFNYRGIDKVLNAVGPALRRHGVIVVPHQIEPHYSTAGRMRECTLRVTYRVYGPKGDHIEMAGVGEGLDIGERATPKALTTAYRNMLITALTIPTEDPKMDPDVVDIQREAPPIRTADDYFQEINDPKVGLNRLHQIRRELQTRPDIAASMHVQFDGVEVKLSDLLSEVGKTKQAQS